MNSLKPCKNRKEVSGIITENRIYRMLGLAAKAGKLVFGAELGMKAVVDGRAKLVIAAADASENVREEFCYRCQTRSLPYLEYGTKFDLGQAVGKPPKAVVCVTDCHFADGIQNIYGGVK